MPTILPYNDLPTLLESLLVSIGKAAFLSFFCVFLDGMGHFQTIIFISIFHDKRRDTFQ